MRRIWLATFALAIGLYCVSSPAQWNGCQAGFCNSVVASGSTYQGPADVFNTSPAIGGSCARAATAALAAAGTPLCDVVDTATGLVTCTFHAQTSGFVNPSECNGVGQACATACSVTKVYDQIGGTSGFIQATLASMPTLTFSAINGLPAINCAGGTNSFMATTSTFAGQPTWTISSVYIRASGTVEGAIFGTAVSATSNSYVSAGNGANLTEMNTQGNIGTAAATDAAWHGVSWLFAPFASGSAITVDGSSNSTLTISPFNANGNTLRLCRGPSGTPLTLNGKIAEFWVWGTTTFAQRTSIFTNQNSVNGYNGAL